MASYEYELVDPPLTERGRELWLQHAVGFVFFEDIRRYAMNEISPSLAPAVRQEVIKGIDSALYGLMMVIDGVSGSISNEANKVQVKFLAQQIKTEDGEPKVVQELDLAQGDGFCMGYHGWLKGDFGSHPVAARKPRDQKE